MAAITVTAAQVAPIGPCIEKRTFTAGEDLTAGQAVYLKSDGKVWKARANAVTTSYFVGIALRTEKAGQPVTVLQRGGLIGLDLSGLAYNAIAYLSSATAGVIDTAAASGTGNVVAPVGRVLCSNESGLPKFLFVDVDFTQILTALS